MSERIKAALQERNGGNQSEMARFIGVSPQAIQKWIAGDSEPRGRNLTKAAEFLGLSEITLRFGDQENAERAPRPERRPSPETFVQRLTIEESELLSAFRSTDKRGRQTILTAAAAVPTLSEFKIVDHKS